MTEISFRLRLLLMCASLIVCVIGAAFAPPISQDPAYHQFADMRSWLGIANFGDSVTSIGFLLVGLWGLVVVHGRRGMTIFDHPSDALPYTVFFLGIALVSVGSFYYHLAPGNDRLFWDRLPITVCFMAFFAAYAGDRIDQRFATRYMLPVLVASGVLSLVYWDWSEARGAGDLRPYALVQFYPIFALPLLHWLFPNGRYTRGRYLFWIIFWYAVAKLLEKFDADIYVLLGQTASGHSLKHLAAAMSAAVVIQMLRRNGADGPSRSAK